MPKGIVRAAERVAFWHEAAEKFPTVIFGDGTESSETAPTTSTPPVGESAPATPKSNKFTYPAKALKTTLDTTAHPSEGFHPQSTQAVEDWATKYPDFTKTYLKPKYQEGLKGHLGEENYAKFLHHAPTPYTDALTTHTQSPAPKSNKFTGPANQLKKILDDPHTETGHVMDWLQGPGAGFAKTYLKPNYDDALKSHLGEQKYHELQQHLSPQAQGQQEEAQPKVDYSEMNIPGVLGLPGDTSEHVKNWLQTPGNGKLWAQLYLQDPAKHKEWQHNDWADTLKQHLPPEYQQYLQPPKSHYDKMLDVAHNGFFEPEDGDYLDTLHSPDFKTWFEKQPGEEQAHYLKWPAVAVHDYQGQGMADPWALSDNFDKEDEDLYQDDDDEGDFEHPWNEERPNDEDEQYSPHSVLDKYAPSDEPETQTVPPPEDWEQQLLPQQSKGPEHDLLDGINKIFPNAHLDLAGMSQDQLKKTLEDQLKYLPETPGYEKYVPQLQALYDQHFGGGGQQQEMADPGFATWLKNEYHTTPEGLGSEAAPSYWKEYQQSKGGQQPSQEPPQHHKDHAQILDAYGEPSEDFKNWFAKDNNWTWGENPAADNQLIEFLHDPENNWTQQKVKGYLKAQDTKEKAFQAWFARTNGMDEEQARHEFAKMGPQGIANWSPGGTYYQQYGPGLQSDQDHIQAIQDLLQPVHQQQQNQPSWLQGHPNAHLWDQYAALPGEFPEGDPEAAQNDFEDWTAHQQQQPQGGGPPNTPEQLGQFADLIGVSPKVKGDIISAWLNQYHKTGEEDFTQYLQSKYPSAWKKWTAQQGGTQQGAHPLQGSMLQFAQDNNWDPSDIALLRSPAFSEWAHQQPSHVQQNGILSPSKTFLQFVSDQGEGNASGGKLTPQQNYQNFLDEVNQHHGMTSLEKGVALSPQFKQWFQQMDPSSYQPMALNAVGDFLAEHPEIQSVDDLEPSGPAPFNALDIAKAMQQADPDTFDDKWVSKVQHSSPEEFESHLKGLMAGNYPPEEKAHYQALLDKYFGDGAPASESDSYSHDLHQIGAEIAQADPAGFGSNYAYDFAKNTPEDAKAILQGLIDEGNGGYFPPEETAQYQQIFDKYFGGGGAEQQTPSSAPQASSYNPTQAWKDWKKIYPSSKIQSTFANAASAETWIKKKLQSSAVPADKKQQLQALYDKHFGQGQQSGPTGHPTPEQLQSALLDKLFTDPHGGAVKAWLSKDPETVKADIETLAGGKSPSGFPLGDNKLQAKWQEVHDALYGQGGQASGGIDINTTKPDKAGLEKFFDTLWPELQGDKESWVNHQLSTTTWNAEYFKQHYPEEWAKAEQLLGGGAQQQQGPPVSYDPSKSPAELGLTVDKLKELGFNASMASQLPHWNASMLAQNMESIEANGGSNYAGGKEWAKLYDYLKSGGQGATQQPSKPDFDWDKFGPAWMALSPNSSWGKSPHSEQEAQQKLQETVQSANASFPSSDKTKALNDLYQKWFPGSSPGAPTPATPTAPPAPPPSKSYQNLLDRADNLKHLFSDKDRATLKSSEFKQWYDKAPSAYRSYIENNPGSALDDYEKGEYSPVPQGMDTKVPKPNRANPFTQKMPSGTPKAFQYNKPRSNQVDFPEKQDEQETLPGVNWGHNYEKLPIYRVLNLNLDKKIDASRAPASVKAQGNKAVQLWAQQQTSRLRRIDQILNGDKAGHDPHKELQQLKNWGSQYNLSDKEVNDLAHVMFAEQGDLFGDDPKWQHFKDLGDKHPDINMSELHDLAAKMSVLPPSGSKGNYDHPELGQLILDYLENTSHRDDDDDGSERGSEGGLGWHWTRAINKIYKGIPSASVGKTDMRATNRNLPIAISGLWHGQGEGAGHGSAFGPHSQDELEHNLHSHAPVEVRRVQIRAPSQENQGYGTWHDTIDHGPISLWGKGRYEEGDEGHRSDSAPGAMVQFKPSLAEETAKVTGIHAPKELDDLKPGHQAEAYFSQLIQDHPDKEKQLLTLYRDFFVGRPDLPTKPHIRRASLQRTVDPHDLDPRDPRHLQALAQAWGVPHPERYGLPASGPTVASIESEIVRLALRNDDEDDNFDKEDEDLYQDDDDEDSEYGEYEPDDFDDEESDYSDDDFEDPPLPTMDRPKGWPQQSPWLKNDPRGRQYFPPHGLNGPSSSQARPDIDWEDEEHEQDPLPLDDGHDDTHTGLGGWDRFHENFEKPTNPQFLEWLKNKGIDPEHPEFDPAGMFPGNHPAVKHNWQGVKGDYQAQTPEPYEWPHDAQPVPLHRGLMLDLGRPDLAHIRRSLLGGDYESDLGEGSQQGNHGPFSNYGMAKAHPLGYDNPELGEKILDHIQNNPKAYQGHQGYGLGPHWSVNEGTAKDFAQQTTMGTGGHPLKLPTVVRAQWKGLGEDPYRTNTQGDWPEEGEVTMLPGAQMHVDSVKIQHPKTKDWHEVLGQPSQRHACDVSPSFPQVAQEKPRSTTSTLRKRSGILTHAEMRA